MRHLLLQGGGNVACSRITSCSLFCTMVARRPIVRLHRQLCTLHKALYKIMPCLVCIAMRMCVCLSACMSHEPCDQTSPNFLCVLSTAVARPCSGCIAIRSVLPVFTDDVIFSHNGPYGAGSALQVDVSLK